MRRKDREITNLQEIIEIIKRCDVCRIALYDEDFPYIIPMNFGFAILETNIELYFHCANTGKKIDLIRSNPKAGFEMDGAHHLITSEKACDYTMEYESICGSGIIEILEDTQKETALTQLMKQYSEDSTFHFDPIHLQAVTVFKLKVKHITGKRLKHSR